MNVLLTDTYGMHVCPDANGVNVNAYRMFEAVLVIFTKALL